MGLSFTVAADPRQRSHSQVRVPRDSWPHFTVRFETPPTWRARSTYLYPPGAGWSGYTPVSQRQSHIATDGQSISKSWCRASSGAHDQVFITLWQLRSCLCGAPSVTRGRACLWSCPSLYSLDTDSKENTASNSYSIVACYITVTQQWLFLWLHSCCFERICHSINTITLPWYRCPCSSHLWFYLHIELLMGVGLWNFISNPYPISLLVSTWFSLDLA
jgi:hypothetical protein